MSEISHLVQDLRASAHRCPEDLRPMIRQAAAELEQRAGLIPIADFTPRSAPIPPPGPDPRKLKGAPCL
jgi:hypothetical protein